MARPLEMAGASGAVCWGEEEDGHHPWGWAVPPGNLWQVGEALPALQTLPQLLQLSAELSAALLSLLPGFGVLSGLWHSRAASPKAPVWGSPKPCAV